MASLRRVKPIPLPGGDFARLKETLHPHYGSKIYEASGPGGLERILVVRVPRPEPDMVNDVEQCVEYLHPGDLQQATSCLLVGDSHTLQYPTQPLRDLMAARIQTDRRHCHLLRGQLKPGESRLFKAPEDPRRQVRLALRLGRAQVADVTEDDLLAGARVLGPQLAGPAYREVRCVYLIADRDDVRMDADLFFQEVQARWGEESERRRLAGEIVQKETAKRIQQEAERQRLLGSLRETSLRETPPRVAVAPLRRSAPAAPWEATPDPRSPLHPLAAPDAARAAMYAQLDALLGIGPPARPAGPPGPPPPGQAFSAPFSAPSPGPAAPAAAPPDGLRPGDPSVPLPSITLPPLLPPNPSIPPGATASAVLPRPPVGPPPPPPGLVALQETLQACGFDVLVRPPGAGGIDLAAERAGAPPHRLIAYCPDRLDAAVADRALATAKAVQADLALVVCAVADPEARKRLVATRVRWVEPSGLADLHL